MNKYELLQAQVVSVVGIEPTRYRYQRILSPLRLPVPPHRHVKSQLPRGPAFTYPRVCLAMLCPSARLRYLDHFTETLVLLSGLAPASADYKSAALTT